MTIIRHIRRLVSLSEYQWGLTSISIQTDSMAKIFQDRKMRECAHANFI